MEEEEKEYAEEDLQKQLEAFEKLRERFKGTRLSTVTLSTMKALPRYERKIKDVEKNFKKKKSAIPDVIIDIIEDKKRAITLMIGTYFSTITTKDIELYFMEEGLGDWTDPKNKWFVVGCLSQSCIRNPIPLAIFTAVTMMEKEISPFEATISATLEFEDATTLKDFPVHFIVEESDIDSYYKASPCVFKTKGSIDRPVGIIIEDRITPVMKAYFQRVVDEEPAMIITGTSGKFDRNSIVRSVKNCLEKGIPIIYVNPQYQRTPLFQYAFCSSNRKDLVLSMDGEEFLLLTLFLRGGKSSDIFPKGGF